MGLTIHYSLRLDSRNVTEARTFIEQLRQRALTLPFKEVGPLIDVSDDAARFQNLPPDHPHRWLLVQADHDVKHGNTFIRVPPRRVIAFSTWPGEGCEQANFGLCIYPATVEIAVWPDRTQRMRTGVSGWSWGSFCKTQYASNPNCGGVENFLRCHLLVVAMLDAAKTLGILADVDDEGDYWQKRDVKALAEEVGSWNEMIAAGAGRLKDLVGDQLEAAILAFPTFEHLEAAGRDHDHP